MTGPDNGDETYKEALAAVAWDVSTRIRVRYFFAALLVAVPVNVVGDALHAPSWAQIVALAGMAAAITCPGNRRIAKEAIGNIRNTASQAETDQ